MKKIKFVIIFLIIFSNSVYSKEIQELIVPVIQSLMVEKNIPNLQIIVFNFNHKKKWLKQLDYNFKENKINLSENLSNYFIGELSYPVISYWIKTDFKNLENKINSNLEILQTIEKNLNKSSYRIRKFDIESNQYIDFKAKNKKDLIFESFLNMISGIDVSKEGIYLNPENLENQVKIRSFPFENFYLSTNNYKILSYALEYNQIESINQFLQKIVKNSFFYSGKVTTEFLEKNKIPFGTFSGKKVKFVSEFYIQNYYSYGMISNVKDYTDLINELYKENLIFDNFYTNSNEKAGYKNGFFYRKSCNNQYYIAENFGFLPGYTTYFFILQNGYGFGIFQSSDNEYIIHYLRDKIEQLFYEILEIHCEEKTMDLFDFKFITGYYRGENILENSFYKNIFTDLWIRFDSKNQLEVSNFFNKDPLGYISSIQDELFLKSYSKLNRYPINLLDEKNNTKKITIGIYEYKKINWIYSIRGIILFFATFVLFIMIIIIGSFVFYEKK